MAPSQNERTLITLDSKRVRDIQLILTDFDGTFCPFSSDSIPRENISAFRRWQNEGFKCAIASGRARSGVKACIGSSSLKEMNYEKCSPGIFMSGATVFVDDAKMISNVYIQTEQQTCLFNLLKEENLLNIAVGCTEEGTFCTERNEVVDKFHTELKEPYPTQVLLGGEDGFFNRKFNKIALCQPPEKIASLRQKIEKKVVDCGLCVVHPLPWTLEISPKGMNKAKGVAALLEHYGLKKENLLVIGDSENDIEMMKDGGISIAVGGADEKVKNAADAITVKCEDNAFARVVDHVMLCKAMKNDPSTFDLL